MTSRVPLLNFVIPVLILYPIPQTNIFYLVLKFLISIALIILIVRSKNKIFNCRKRFTKYGLLGISVIISFNNFNYVEKSTFEMAPREVLAEVEIEGEYIENNKFYYVSRVKQTSTCNKTCFTNYVLLNKEGLGQGLSKVNSQSLIIKGIVYSKKGSNIKIDVKSFSILEKNGNSFFTQIKNLRDKFIHRIWNDSKASNDTKAFLIGITTGIKNLMTNSEKEKFIESGTMHLFAVSGLHFGVLYLFVKFIILKLGFSKRYSVSTILILLFLYLCFIDFSNSAKRAFFMIAAWEISRVIHKESNSLSCICLSLVIIVVFNPQIIFDIGFQLSFTIVLSIIWFLRGISSNEYTVQNKIINIFCCSFAAFCGGFCLMFSIFDQIVLNAIFANMILVPLSVPIILVVIVYLILFFSIGFDFSYFIDYLYTFILNFIDYLLLFPFGFIMVQIDINHYFTILYSIFLILSFNKNLCLSEKFKFITLYVFVTILIALFAQFINDQLFTS